MTMLERNTACKDATLVSLPVAAGTKVVMGCIASSNANGCVVNGGGGKEYLGRLESTVDNSLGADGDLHVIVRRREAFLWDNDTAAPVTQASLGQLCYVLNEHTMCATETGYGAAVVVEVTSEGVWVE